jgi:hypothetical protein
MQITFRAGKPPAGAFIIAGGLQVKVFTKPFVLHRWAMRLAFGWRWVPAARVAG